MPLTISIPTDVTDLHRDPSGTAPWPIEMALSLERRELTVRSVANDAGTPIEVHTGRELVWRVPLMRRQAYEALLGEVAPLAERIIADSEVVYDGGQGAHVGQLGPDAEAARNEITQLVDEWQLTDDERVAEISVDEWAREHTDDPREVYGITADTTPDEVYDIARQIEADIRAEAAEAMGVEPGDVLVTGADGWVREQVRALWREALAETAAELDQLTVRRDTLIRWLVGAGESGREVARIVGVAHTTVQRIVRGQA